VIEAQQAVIRQLVTPLLPIANDEKKPRMSERRRGLRTPAQF
jgi:hypothetical protein